MIKISFTYEIYAIFAFNCPNLSERFLYVHGCGCGGGGGTGWGLRGGDGVGRGVAVGGVSVEVGSFVS